eukprot:5156631-Amphidinium_carterae.1
MFRDDPGVLHSNTLTNPDLLHFLRRALLVADCTAQCSSIGTRLKTFLFDLMVSQTFCLKDCGQRVHDKRLRATMPAQCVEEPLLDAKGLRSEGP